MAQTGQNVVYQGLATFPGVPPTLILSAEFALSHGITPSSGIIRCALGSALTTTVGTLQIAFGPVGGASPTALLVFPGALIVNSTTQLGPEGFVTTLHFFDRRWAWHFGEINGNYNVRFGNAIQQPGQLAGTLDPLLARTPQQLAALCLWAMGERNFDVSQLPNDSYPEVTWDRTNPAQALASLVEALGCRVVLRLDGSVLIARSGFGRLLPSGGEECESLGVKVNQPPDSIRVICGKTRYQNDFYLVPVGLDLDNRLKPIDQLSYTPRGGWANQDPRGFENVDANLNNFGVSARKLAEQSVWRWYQIAAPDVDGSRLVIPGYSGKIRSIRQILPIEDQQVIQTVNAAGIAENVLAQVYGTYAFDNGNANANWPFPQVYQNGFSIDTERGIVQFNDPVYLLGPQGQTLPAAIYLRSAVSIRGSSDWTWDRGEVFQAGIAANGTGPLTLSHDEIVLNVIAVYNPAVEPPRLLGVVSSAAAVIVEGFYYINATLLDYQVATTKDVTYVGIVPISPDGLIQQVTWTIGESGARTRASLNTEHHVGVPPFRERRFFERLRGQVGKALDKAAAKLRDVKGLKVNGGAAKFGGF